MPVIGAPKTARAKTADIVNGILGNLPLLEAWIAPEAGPNLLHGVVSLIDKVGKLSPGVYVLDTRLPGDVVRFLDVSVRRLFSDSSPVAVKVCTLSCIFVVPIAHDSRITAYV